MIPESVASFPNIRSRTSLALSMRLRSDVGIVYSKGGPIAMAITVDGMTKRDYTPDNAGSILIADLAKILVEGLATK